MLVFTNIVNLALYVLQKVLNYIIILTDFIESSLIIFVHCCLAI